MARYPLPTEDIFALVCPCGSGAHGGLVSLGSDELLVLCRKASPEEGTTFLTGVPPTCLTCRSTASRLRKKTPNLKLSKPQPLSIASHPPPPYAKPLPKACASFASPFPWDGGIEGVYMGASPWQGPWGCGCWGGGAELVGPRAVAAELRAAEAAARSQSCSGFLWAGRLANRVGGCSHSWVSLGKGRAMQRVVEQDPALLASSPKPAEPCWMMPSWDRKLLFQGCC